MTFQRFFILLIATSLAVIAGNLILQSLFPVLQNHINILWWSLELYIIISIFMFLMGSRTVDSSNKNDFSGVVIGFVLFKMLISIALILFYRKVFHPESKTFIVPFFIVYFSFTIFEMYFMTQLTRKKK